MPRVNPDILRWARQTAGLAPEVATAELRLRDSGKGTALERLEALETGEETPTRPMLVRMAKAYRRPLLTFYLAEPPSRGDRGEDFRTLPADAPEEEEGHLDALLRQIRARQRLVRAVLEDEDEAETLPFIGSLERDDGAPAFVEAIRATLSLSLEEYRSESGPYEAFTLARSRTEEAGIFVILMGDLGSYHTALDTTVFRGFALADEVAPFVVINDRDSHAAWTFTLFHELAHVWMGRTGVSGGRPEVGIERFCNDVASQLLVLPSEIQRVAADLPPGDSDTEALLARYAREWKVSRSLIAYRLYREGALSQNRWRELHDRLKERWEHERTRARLSARDRAGGPDYYTVRRQRLGSALIELTARMLDAGALTTTKAGRILGVRPARVGRLLRDLDFRTGWRGRL